MDFIDPELYVEAMYAWQRLKDEYPDVTLNQDFVAYVLEPLNMTNEEKAYLFQMFNKSWKSGKNPFSSAAGSVAYDAMHADDVEVDKSTLRLPFIPD